METQKIVVAPGDGIGPELTDAVLDILSAAKVPLEYEKIQVGQSVYLKGLTVAASRHEPDYYSRE